VEHLYLVDHQMVILVDQPDMVWFLLAVVLAVVAVLVIHLMLLVAEEVAVLEILEMLVLEV
jgi:hypothetical protein